MGPKTTRTPLRAGRFACAVALVSAAVFLALPPSSAEADPGPPALADTVVQSGLVIPWDLAFAPGGRMFVTERAGRIRIYASGAPNAALLATINVPNMQASGEAGLMGIVFDPNFASNQFLYVCASQNDSGWWNNVLRYRETAPNTLTLDGYVSRRQMAAASTHNGCRLRFGPDGKLWVTMGDAQTSSSGQNPNSHNGKALRFNTDGTVPSDNPILPGAAGRTAAYTMGHRNPQGLAFQPGTGLPFEAEHGPDTDDEINVLVAGRNYGWPTVTGNDGAGGFADPAWESNSPTIATSGAEFVTGPSWGSWSGSLFVATLKESDLRRFVVSGTTVTPAEILFNAAYGRLRSVLQGPDGALYVTTSNGSNDKVIRITATTLGATYSATPPTTWGMGQTQTYTVNVTNTGGETWRAAGMDRVRLGVHFGTASDGWGSGWATDQRFDLPADVASGGSVSLTVSVTAPRSAGSYVLRHRMLKEGVAWFDQVHKTTVAVSRPAATYSSMPPTTWYSGETQTYSITITNSGVDGWNAAGTNRVQLGVHFGGASDGWHEGWVTDQRFNLPADVAPGASVTLTLNVTAPATSGSFVLRHRMLRDGVAWFDQIQKTTVTVQPALVATYTSTPPTTWAGGQTQTYTVRVTNAGGQTWNASGSNRVRLGVHFGTASDAWNSGWATDQRFDLPTDVAPGNSVDVSVDVTAPSAAGSYVLRHRMLKEGVAWFDQVQRTPLTIPQLGATYASSPAPAWDIGQTRVYAVTVQNVGAETWLASGPNRVRLGVHFGTASDAWGAGWATDQRFDLGSDVAPGASATLAVATRAPLVPGSYVLRHRMVKEGVAWFAQGHKTDVSVSLPAASYVASPPTSWHGGQTQSYTVRVTNDGNDTWNSTGPNAVRLGVHFGTSSDGWHDGWATDQRFDLPGDVAPGAAVDLTVAVTAPQGAGSYVLRHRIVKDGLAWTAQAHKTPVTIPSLSAGYTSTPPTSWVTGQSQTYAITVKNLGAETWRATGTNRVRLGVHFGTASDAWGDGWVTDERFELPADLAPGASVTITVTVTPPSAGGTYVLRHRMVKESIAWFDQVQKTTVGVS